MDESALVQGLGWRARALDELGWRAFDLLVIGGGIIGAGIANEAASAGLAVALVDKGDFGGATSSASSKLIHGGLRYLRLGDVGLVREAHAERRVLARVVAPHLVHRLPFLVPLYDDGPYRPATVRAGLWLYSTLARERLGRVVTPDRAGQSVPDLRREGLRGCGLYSDAWTHDARLCLANVRAAADAGATVLNYAPVRDLRIAGGRVCGAELDGISVSARAVVNATGPWVDRVRKLEEPTATPSVRLSKGVHALLPLDRPWSAALTIPHDEVRVSFAVPWEGMLMLGTTDSLYEGEPDDVRATEEDVGQVLSEASVALGRVARRDAVRSVYAGLRVLPGAGDQTASARRETVYTTGPAGMLSVAGGKLTTYRRIALGALAALRSDLGLHRVDERPRPLPGARDLEATSSLLATRFPALDPSARAHLVHLYGALADEVTAPALERPELLKRLHPDAPDIVAQGVYAWEREWAVREDDVLARRTTVALRGLSVTGVAALAGAAPSRPF